MDLQIIDEPQMPAELDAAIRQTLRLCYPHHEKTFETSRAINGNVPAFTLVLLDGSVVAAHIAVMDRTIRVGKEQVRVAGIANVAVPPDYRGQSLSRKLIAEVIHESKRRGYEFGMLFAGDWRVDLYAAAGWMRIDGRHWKYICDGKEIDLEPHRIGMFHPCCRDEFPPGDVHLQGFRW